MSEIRMLGLMQEKGTFQYQLEAREDGDRKWYDIHIQPSHFHRLGIFLATGRNRCLTSRAYLAPPWSEITIHANDVDESKINVELALTEGGQETLQVSYLQEMFALSNIREWEFQMLTAAFMGMQEQEEGVNSVGDKLACVFCGKDGKVRAEGFAPECDECADELGSPGDEAKPTEAASKPVEYRVKLPQVVHEIEVTIQFEE